MNNSRNNLRRQIIIGMTGVLAVLLLWRASAPYLSSHLPETALGFVNCASMLSLGIPPLLIIIREKDSFCAYGITGKNMVRQVLIGIGIGVGMSVVLIVFPVCIGWRNIVYTGINYASAAEALRELAYFVFVVGATEEFIFRGFLYGKMKLYCLSDSTAMIISALLFGLFHFSGISIVKILIGVFFCLCLNRVPGCTVLSLSVAHGIHDWMIRFLPALIQG